MPHKFHSEDTLGKDILVPVGVSNRHVHVSDEDLKVLFGQNYRLQPLKYLTQSGEFAAQETVTLVGPKGVLENVRILGPARENTQVEISQTDAFKLGIKPPVRESGDIDGTPGIAVVGPKGALTLEKGVILAARHIHMSPEDAEKAGLEDGESVKVLCPGSRGIILDKVLVRVKPSYKLEMHVDTDEANAALLKNGQKCKILH